MASRYTSVKKALKPTKIPKISKGAKVVIVGNGMAGCHFCKGLVNRGLSKVCDITVLGAEAIPAYDRIHLSDYVDNESTEDLILQGVEWYEENGIRLVLGAYVTNVDTEQKSLVTAGGERYDYDVLVFATGSSAFCPSMEGADNEKVILYRTVEDVEKIVSTARGKTHATVIGGGLLGLEAAQAVQKLGLQASVLQLGGHLMSAQLNPAGAQVLKGKVEQAGIEVLTLANTKKVSNNKEGLQLDLADGRSLDTDFVIVAAGIRANSSVAEKAGIKCGIRGGIIVDNNLQTSADDVFAIGECALFEGQTFGLAAPGYAMADHVVCRLAGDKIKPLEKPDMSTKLKMVGVDVTTIGDALEEGVLYEFKSDDVYRALNLSPKGELLGALGVGEWAESTRLQTLYNKGGVIQEKEREYFVKEGVLSENSGEDSVIHWADNSLVCNCMSVTKGDIIACFKTCGKDPDAIAKETSCSEVCGSCRPLLEELCGAETLTPNKPVGVKSLMVFSIIAALGVLAILISPPAPIADSVESWYYKVDKLWRSSVVKQITGYTMMGVFLLGLLISLRKRFKWFRFGHFNNWRVFHSIFGVVSLVTLFAHTGFHFGHNLNYWLMLTFVLLNLLGGFAGVFAAIESSGITGMALVARKYRPVLTYAHLVLFWPLPILLVFHIASVYLY